MPKIGSKYTAIVAESYPNVLKLVEQGLTIRQALNKLNVCSSNFYKHITKDQKAELKMIKTANAKYTGGTIQKIYDKYKII